MLKTGMIIAERYEIVGKIGTGGMADVYKAMDHKLNRFVAVKVLKPEFREDTTFIKRPPVSQSRFLWGWRRHTAMVSFTEM